MRECNERSKEKEREITKAHDRGVVRGRDIPWRGYMRNIEKCREKI